MTRTEPAALAAEHCVELKDEAWIAVKANAEKKKKKGSAECFRNTV